MLDCPTFIDLKSLSARESQIVSLVAQGMTNREIAESQSISEGTVKNHLHTIFEKLHVDSRLELALFAVHNGLLLGLISDEFLGRHVGSAERRAK